jgi:hypothetical protein
MLMGIFSFLHLCFSEILRLPLLPLFPLRQSHVKMLNLLHVLMKVLLKMLSNHR